MGSNMATGAGGCGFYTFSIDGINFQSSGIFNNLAAKTYTVTAKDANNCLGTTQVPINAAPAAVIASATPTQPKCSTDLGSINASASGGTGSYTFSIDGVNFQSSGIFNNLAAKTYTVTAKDANNCLGTTQVPINAAPAAVIASATPTQPKCSTDLGSINASATGGTGSYTFSIDGVSFQSSGLF